MESTVCKRCGYRRATDVLLCPYCGAPRRLRWDRVALALALLVVVAGQWALVRRTALQQTDAAPETAHANAQSPRSDTGEGTRPVEAPRDSKKKSGSMNWWEGSWEDARAARLAAQANRTLAEQASPRHAIQVMEMLLATAGGLSAGDFRKTVGIVNEHVRLYYAMGMDHAALQLAAKATGLARNRKDDDAACAACLATLADLQRLRGDWGEAEKLLSEAAEKLKRTPDNADLLVSLLSLHELQSSMGENEKARLTLQQALKLADGQPRDHPDRAAVLRALAELCARSGDDKEAERLLLEAQQVKPRNVLNVRQLEPGWQSHQREASEQAARQWASGEYPPGFGPFRHDASLADYGLGSGVRSRFGPFGYLHHGAPAGWQRAPYGFGTGFTGSVGWDPMMPGFPRAMPRSSLDPSTSLERFSDFPHGAPAGWQRAPHGLGTGFTDPFGRELGMPALPGVIGPVEMEHEAAIRNLEDVAVRARGPTRGMLEEAGVRTRRPPRSMLEQMQAPRYGRLPGSAVAREGGVYEWEQLQKVHAKARAAEAARQGGRDQWIETPLQAPSLASLLDQIETDLSLGRLYARTGRRSEAERLLNQAAQLAKDKLGEGGPAHVLALNRLVSFYLGAGEFAKAGKESEKAQQHCREGHPLYTLTQLNQAVLCQEAGDHGRAASLMENVLRLELQRANELLPLLSEAQALNFLKANLQVRDPLLVSLASLPDADPERAYAAVWRTRALATRAFVATRQWVRKHPEAQAIQAELVLKRSQLAEVTLSAGMISDEAQRAGLLAQLTEEKEQLERRLGALRKELEETQEKPPRNSDTAADRDEPSVNRPEDSAGPQPDGGRAILKEWVQSLSDQVARVAEARQEIEDPGRRRRRLDELAQRKKTLEEQVGDAGRQLQDLEGQHPAADGGAADGERDMGRVPAGATGDREATIAELAGRLPRDAAVVDMIRRRVVPSRKLGGARLECDSHYEAFVLRRSDDPAKPYRVAWVGLGPCGPIDAAIAQWRQLLKPGAGGAQIAAGDASEPPDRQLRRIVWDRVEPQLAGCRTVIVVPDQDLTRVPWAALPGRRPGAYLLEEYSVCTATHGHGLADLLSRPPQRSAASRMLLLGGVDYDSTPSPQTVPDGPLLAAARSRARLHAPGRPPLWRPLASAAREIETLRNLWGSRGPVELLTGSGADKSRLVAGLPRARYVHLATHGFFAGPEFHSVFEREASPEEAFGQADALEGPAAAGRNPLLLSGLALAGANRPPGTDALGLPAGNGGLLTAEEIVDLDLTHNELVVLSACETGLGNVAGGEGVFGLQRAFHLAGAHTVVASLWSVDDAATRTLMVEFYQNLWGKQLGKLEALRQAQLAMIQRYSPDNGGLRGIDAVSKPIGPVEPSREKPPGTGAGRPLPPFFWAAFVLSGDWR